MRLRFFIILLAGSMTLQISAQNVTVSSEECFNITWFGGAAGNAGKTVKGKLKQYLYIIKYDWKNGVMNYDWLNDGGRVTGIQGTWKQDGSNGSFILTKNGENYSGFWSSSGNSKKNKLTFAKIECK